MSVASPLTWTLCCCSIAYQKPRLRPSIIQWAPVCVPLEGKLLSLLPLRGSLVLLCWEQGGQSQHDKQLCTFSPFTSSSMLGELADLSKVLNPKQLPNDQASPLQSSCAVCVCVYYPCCGDINLFTHCKFTFRHYKFEEMNVLLRNVPRSGGNTVWVCVCVRMWGVMKHFVPFSVQKCSISIVHFLCIVSKFRHSPCCCYFQLEIAPFPAQPSSDSSRRASYFLSEVHHHLWLSWVAQLELRLLLLHPKLYVSKLSAIIVEC